MSSGDHPDTSLGSNAAVAARLDALRSSEDNWAGLRVVVVGLGVSGFSVADALLERGAQVTVIDASPGQSQKERGIILDTLGAEVLLGPEHMSTVPDVAGSRPELVVTSPGFSPRTPVLQAAAQEGLAIWGDVELAWRMRSRSNPAAWLVLTGTNGKTTTVKMLESMLKAHGARAIAAGNVGTPLLEAVLHPQPYDVIAVELSSFQLHWTHSLRPLASAVLNIAEDHIDWHGSMQEYASAKAKIYENTEVACVFNVADLVTEQMVRDADVVEGCRAVGFSSGVPGLSELGLVEDILCDRAFVEQRHSSAAELADLKDLRMAVGPSLADHHITNALAAAALARAYGVTQAAVRDGLRSMRPEPHRIELVAESDDVRWVNDSKATNPHAAAASLSAFESVVWVAGGLAKGATFEDLVQHHGSRMRAAVLLGTDRGLIRAALEQHAPQVDIYEVEVAQTGNEKVGDDVMRQAVHQAGQLAQPGDAVLMAPACASMDQFNDYAHRGDAFKQAVQQYLMTQG